jgi:hypothetical protein
MAATNESPTSEALRGVKVLLKYFVSATLWQVLNPLGIVQTLMQIGGQFIAQVRWLLKGAPIQPVPMALPFNGEWQVFNGGIDKSTSHSWGLVAQRYAYDFLISQANGKNHMGDGKRPQDFLCWGKDIFAPADGVVISARNDVRDSPHVGGWIDVTTPDIRGNYIVIRHAAHVFSLCGHLQQGSVVLKPGDVVQQGQAIGRCGNSGHSTEPHLHFQVQDHPNFYLAVGLPVVFQNVELRNPSDKTSETITQGYIHKGRAVTPLPGTAAGATLTQFVQPQLSWADPLITLITAALVLMGLVSIFSRIIDLVI